MGKNGRFLRGVAPKDHVSGFHAAQHMFFFQLGTCKLGLAWLELNTQAPQTIFFGPKMTILGLFGAKNGHSLCGAALKPPFSGLHTLQHTFFQSSICKIGLPGLELTSLSQNNSVFGPKLAFLGHFWAKNAHFLSGVALKHPCSGCQTLQHMFF